MAEDIINIAIRKYNASLKEVRSEIKKLPVYNTMREWEKIIISQGGKVPEDDDTMLNN